VIVIMETCRVVSKLQGTVQPLDNAGKETVRDFKSTLPKTFYTNTDPHQWATSNSLKPQNRDR